MSFHFGNICFSLVESRRGFSARTEIGIDGPRYCHLREEHLLPLHVYYGAAIRRCAFVPAECTVIGLDRTLIVGHHGII